MLKIFFLTCILLVFECFVHFLLIPQQFTDGEYLFFQTPSDLLLYTLRKAGWLYLLACLIFSLIMWRLKRFFNFQKFPQQLIAGIIYALSCFAFYSLLFTQYENTAFYLKFLLIYGVSGMILGILHFVFFSYK
jgi:hypothetical protein